MKPKCGEADHVEREPRIGSRMQDGAGRTWVKAQHLGKDAWGKALCDTTFQVRVALPVTDEHVLAMGYVLDDTR